MSIYENFAKFFMQFPYGDFNPLGTTSTILNVMYLTFLLPYHLPHPQPIAKTQTIRKYTQKFKLFIPEAFRVIRYVVV